MLAERGRRIVGTVHEHRLQEMSYTHLLAYFETLSVTESRTRTADPRPIDIDFITDGDRFIEILYLLNDDQGSEHLRK
jgi:hypothetical protein